jgi:cytochrome c oxidase assembly protein subunit 11
MSAPSTDKSRAGLAGLTAAICVVFVAGMVGMSFAAVPLYRIFCQVTGFGGTTQRADTAPERALEREITVRFDGNVANGLGWSFRPRERHIRLRVGEVAEIAFIAENRGGIISTGTAAFNVTPNSAGAYFNKMACFCFTDQTLKPGETVDMPVQFFVDPAIAENSELDYIDSITLSYTFFPTDNPEPKPLAAAPSGGLGSHPL